MSKEPEIVERLDGCILRTKVYVIDANLAEMNIQQEPELGEIFLDVSEVMVVSLSEVDGLKGVMCTLPGPLDFIVQEDFEEFYGLWATIKNFVNGIDDEEQED